VVSTRLPLPLQLGAVSTCGVKIVALHMSVGDCEQLEQLPQLPGLKSV
jgi:hypothetical protein